MKKQNRSNIRSSKERTFTRLYLKYKKRYGKERAEEIINDFNGIILSLEDYVEEIVKNEVESRLIDERVKWLNTERAVRRNCLKKWFLLILLVIAGAIGIALVVIYYDLDGYAISCGVAFAILSAVMDFIFSLKNISGYIRNGDERAIEGIINVLKELYETFKRRSLLHLLAIITIMFFLGNCLAKANAVDVVPKILAGDVLITLEIKENEEEVITNSISKDMMQLLTGGDKKLISMMTRTDVTFEQRAIVYNLSLGDYNTVFFQNDLYNVMELENQEQINEMILCAVKEFCSQEKENIFDQPEKEGGAPESLKDEICMASQKEEVVNSYQDVKEILNIRESAYLKYPKNTLAKLIANGYQKLALMLIYNGGNENTIIYLYGQSILYNFEYLKHVNNPDNEIKERLMIIAQRYTDIVYLYPEFKDAQIAQKLAEAFRYVANQY